MRANTEGREARGMPPTPEQEALQNVQDRLGEASDDTESTGKASSKTGKPRRRSHRDVRPSAARVNAWW
jgi:hypothetical protein